MNSLEFTKERNDRIKSEICDRYSLEWKTICSKSRRVKIIEARRLYCALLRNIFELPLQSIGKLTNTHHATIIHSVKQYKTYAELYNGYDNDYEEIKASLIDETSMSYFLDEMTHLERKKKILQKQIDNLILIQKQQ
tara:strand:- start:2316 stop:2726 length:411 start_codon:yes stop_codon:yes gene_type:complete